jgi:hypothetical protein
LDTGYSLDHGGSIKNPEIMTFYLGIKPMGASTHKREVRVALGEVFPAG